MEHVFRNKQASVGPPQIDRKMYTKVEEWQKCVMEVDMDADGRRRCNIFYANATQFPNGKLHCPIIPGTSLEEDIASSDKRASFLLFSSTCMTT